MVKMLQDLGAALRAERLKLKGTLAFWLAFIAPAVIVALQVVMMIARKDFHYAHAATDIWADYAMQVMILWALVMLPLFVTLETALIAQLDHANQAWKHLFTLPVRRGTLYAAKQLGGMALIGLSLITITALAVVGGLILRQLLPGLGFEESAPVGEIAEFAMFVFLGAWLVISIQTWVAQRWPNFVVASGFGIAMTIIGTIVVMSEFAGYYPWTLPVLVANGFSERIRPLNVLEEGVLPIRQLLMGSIGGVVVAVLGGWDVTSRDVI